MTRLIAVVEGTIRESMAKFTFLAFLAMSSLTLLIVAFAVNLDVVDGALAAARLFGQEINIAGQRLSIDELVTGFEAGLAGLLFGVGLFLSVFATANLLPTMLEKGYVDLLLSKPLSRTSLLLGRYLGCLGVVCLNLVYLVAGIWILVGWKTGIWGMGLPWAGILIVLTFAILLGFMFLVGVTTRSSSITIMLTYALFPLSMVLAAREQVTAMLTNSFTIGIINGLYYVLPKMTGLGRLLGQLVLQKPISGWMPLWSSALFGAGCLSLAFYYFNRKDY